MSHSGSALIPLAVTQFPLTSSPSRIFPHLPAASPASCSSAPCPPPPPRTTWWSRGSSLRCTPGCRGPTPRCGRPWRWSRWGEEARGRPLALAAPMQVSPLTHRAGAGAAAPRRYRWTPHHRQASVAVSQRNGPDPTDGTGSAWHALSATCLRQRTCRHSYVPFRLAAITTACCCAGPAPRTPLHPPPPPPPPRLPPCCCTRTWTWCLWLTRRWATGRIRPSAGRWRGGTSGAGALWTLRWGCRLQGGQAGGGGVAGRAACMWRAA